MAERKNGRPFRQTGMQERRVGCWVRVYLPGLPNVTHGIPVERECRILSCVEGVRSGSASNDGCILEQLKNGNYVDGFKVEEGSAIVNLCAEMARRRQ